MAQHQHSETHMWTCLSDKEDRIMTILGENWDERYGLDEYDAYNPFEGEEEAVEEEAV